MGIADVGTELINYVDQCTDLKVGAAVWEDRQGYKCTSHRGRGWCTGAGKETQAYLDDKPNNRQTFARNAKNDGMYAPKACCGCGGGSLGGSLNTLPPPLTSMVASQMFVM